MCTWDEGKKSWDEQITCLRNHFEHNPLIGRGLQTDEAPAALLYEKWDEFNSDCEAPLPLVPAAELAIESMINIVNNTPQEELKKVDKAVCKFWELFFELGPAMDQEILKQPIQRFLLRRLIHAATVAPDGVDRVWAPILEQFQFNYLPDNWRQQVEEKGVATVLREAVELRTALKDAAGSWDFLFPVARHGDAYGSLVALRVTALKERGNNEVIRPLWSLEPGMHPGDDDAMPFEQLCDEFQERFHDNDTDSIAIEFDVLKASDFDISHLQDNNACAAERHWFFARFNPEWSGSSAGFSLAMGFHAATNGQPFRFGLATGAWTAGDDMPEVASVGGLPAKFSVLWDFADVRKDIAGEVHYQNPFLLLPGNDRQAVERILARVRPDAAPLSPPNQANAQCNKFDIKWPTDLDFFLNADGLLTDGFDQYRAQLHHLLKDEAAPLVRKAEQFGQVSDRVESFDGYAKEDVIELSRVVDAFAGDTIANQQSPFLTSVPYGEDPELAAAWLFRELLKGPANIDGEKPLGQAQAGRPIVLPLAMSDLRLADSNQDALPRFFDAIHKGIHRLMRKATDENDSEIRFFEQQPLGRLLRNEAETRLIVVIYDAPSHKATYFKESSEDYRTVFQLLLLRGPHALICVCSDIHHQKWIEQTILRNAETVPAG